MTPTTFLLHDRQPRQRASGHRAPHHKPEPEAPRGRPRACTCAYPMPYAEGPLTVCRLCTRILEDRP